jgi:trimethylamine monooxygenase
MPGIEDFPGLIIHSHNFRDGADFKGDRLLVVGTGYSGEDIAMQCYKFGSPMVTVLHRTAPMAHDFKDWKIDEKPVAGTRYDKTTNQFVFADGTSNTYDKIIYCTGYKHTFPFLAPDLQFSTNNRLIPNTLWKATVLPTNNALFFVGMPDQYYTFSYFQGQALFIKGIIEGKVTLPTAEAMLADTADWQAREDALGDDHKTHHRFQYQHMAEACTLAGCSFRDDSGHFDQWLDDRHHNILTYRDQTAISSVSGTRSVTLPMPWTEYMNDDKQVYLDHCRAAHEKNIKAAQQ